jgi:ubiquinone/menaquinone biosynthesis C-methylase UbiE
MKTKIYNVFDKNAFEYDSWFDKNKYLYLTELEVVKEGIGKKKYKNAIEIGVGTGRFSEPFGIKIGLEPSEDMGKLAVKRGIAVVKGYGENIPFFDESFDLVLIAFTLCFVKDPIKVLTESKRILKKRGRIVIGIIDKDTELGRMYLLKKKTDGFYRDAKFYSSLWLIEKLKKLKFKNITTYQTLFKPQNLKNLRKLDRIEKGHGRGGFCVISGEKI